MNLLLRLLLLFAFPHATEGDPDPDDDAAEDDGDDGMGDGETVNEEVVEPDQKPDPITARLEAAETAAREAREQIQVLQRAKPDPTADEEERKLRDPNTTDLEKWQIQSNRALRQSQVQSQQALFQAQDMADKTTYTVKSASNPLYGKYEARVEAELTKARALGANPPREFLLEREIGRDMLKGNLKAATAKTKASAIPRGKPNSARSDTPSRSGMTEHQKRAARLADQQI